MKFADKQYMQVLLIWLILSLFGHGCNFQPSSTGFDGILPSHSASIKDSPALEMKQESYRDYPISLHLISKEESRDFQNTDAEFWEHYLFPYSSGNRSMQDLIQQLGGQAIVGEHNIKQYRCRLSRFGELTRPESLDSNLVLEFIEPCQNNSSYFAKIDSGSTKESKALYFSELATRLEFGISKKLDLIELVIDLGFKSVRVLNYSHSLVIVAVATNGDLYVYFHGSMSTEHWRSNLTFKLIPDTFVDPSMGLVHEGFSESIQELWPALQETILDLDANNYVHFVGYSRGGALAVLAALKWSVLGNESTAFTFGQPRIGGEDAIQFMKNQSKFELHRILNHGDIIGHMPPENDSLKEFEFVLQKDLGF